jgi:predicted nucleotidyltransferase
MKSSANRTLTAGLDSGAKDAIRSFLDRATAMFDVSSAKLFGIGARVNARPVSDFDIAIILRGKREDIVGTKLEMTDLAYTALLKDGIHR